MNRYYEVSGNPDGTYNITETGQAKVLATCSDLDSLLLVVSALEVKKRLDEVKLLT